MTIDLLKSLICNLPDELRYSSIDGDCDAFAMSLNGFLKEIGIESRILVGSRLEYDLDFRETDDNPLSHVVVEALDTTWDAQGASAQGQWEQSWAILAESDVFNQWSWDVYSVNDLISLRQERDNRLPSSGLIKECHEALLSEYATMTSVAA